MSYVAPIISGILLALSFPHPGIGILAWFALVPLLLSIRGKPPRASFLLGFVCGLSFNVLGVYWLINTMSGYGGLPYPVSAALMVMLAAYMSFYFGAFAWISSLAYDKAEWLAVVVLPASWAAIELARNYLLSGFPWNLLGYSQTPYLHVIQIADITGIYGVSALIVAANAGISAIACATLNRRAPAKNEYMAVVVASLAVISTLAYGHYSLTNQPEPSGKIKVALVQGNIDQFVKWDPAYQTEVFETYRAMTEELDGQGPGLIVWPETATPFYMQDYEWRSRLHEAANASRTYLLTGSPSFEVAEGPDGEKTYTDYNSAYLFGPDGEIISRYDKMHLVPFGEYVPMKTLLPFVSKMVVGIGDFGRGEEYTVMNTPKASFGTAICFEVIFPELVRRFALNGATLLTSITNDAWFGDSSAPYQHFAMAAMRAVENRRTMVRAANTGISGIILPSGTVAAHTDIFTRGYIVRDVPLYDGMTFYSKHGDLFAYVCVLICLVFLVSYIKPGMYNIKSGKGK